MEKRELDTGSFKQLVENYTQEDTDPVTCCKFPPLILFYATVLLVLLSKADDLLITLRGDVKLGEIESMLYNRMKF